jgi:hypothetical protein
MSEGKTIVCRKHGKTSPTFELSSMPLALSISTD